MYRQRNRFLSTLLCIIFICSSVQAAILQISVRDSTDNSTIPQATLFLNGTSYTRTDNNGQAFINHSGLADLLIRVTATGYYDWENLVAKNETSILANLSRKGLILKIILYDSDSLGSVSGARVNISAKNLIQTNLTNALGSVSFDANATTLYAIHIAAPDYQSRDAVIETGIGNTEAQYWLLPSNRFSFVIKDKDGLAGIPEVDVQIDGILVGKTDIRGVLTIPVKRGEVHAIQIKKSGYQTFTESRTINETDALETVGLSKALLGAVIYTYDENHVPVNGSEIYVNGTLSGKTNEVGRSTLSSIIAGSYIIEARKTGYTTINRTITLASAGEEFSIEMPSETADLSIFVEENDQKLLTDVMIYINDKASGITDDHGRYATKVKFKTLYNITAVKETYKPVSVQKQFAQGEANPSVTLIMEKNTDWGLITLVIVGIAGIIVVFWIIRMSGGRKRRHVMRKNDI